MVETSCSQCGRYFHLDPERAARAGAAKCVCGTLIDLRPDRGTSGRQRLGKYVLERRIAAGGMGEIYYGKIAGVEGFEREVAIKKMLPHLSSDPSFVEMLIKEAKLTVLLNHPNIVQVYDLARDGDEYYIAMEYVHAVNVGNLLHKCIRIGAPIPVEMAVHVALQVLKGLAYAHGFKGPDGQPMCVLHRDITPQNILVTPQAWVKITDFGIAKARNEISTTSPGMIKGKLGYIAPEQLQGQAPDHRVDIFCTGILLWEMLASRRLFKGTDEIDTFRLIAEAAVPSLRGLRREVSPELEQAILGGLAKDVEERHGTADIFYDALLDAIAPLTVDSCAGVARSFLEGYEETFFGELAAQSFHAETTETPTVAFAEGNGQALPVITELVFQPPKKRRLGRWLAVVALAVAIGGSAGLAAGPYRDRLIQALGWGGERTEHEDKPAPEGLTAREVQLVVDGERQRIEACYRRGSAGLYRLAAVHAALVIPSTGSVAKVTFRPAPKNWGRAEACLQDLFGGLRFRRHSSPVAEHEVKLPLPKKPPRLTPLTQAEIAKTVASKRNGLEGCLKTLSVSTAPERIFAKVKIDASGKVPRVSIQPKIARSVEQCLQRFFLSLRFRASKNGTEFTFPLIVDKGGR